MDHQANWSRAFFPKMRYPWWQKMGVRKCARETDMPQVLQGSWKNQQSLPGVASSVYAPEHHRLGKAPVSSRVPTCRQGCPWGGFSKLHQDVRKGLVLNQWEGDDCFCCYHLNTGRKQVTYIVFSKLWPSPSHSFLPFSQRNLAHQPSEPS